ncbi:MAG: ribosome biogenesis GTPase Der [Kiritimatiellia bacterium]
MHRVRDQQAPRRIVTIVGRPNVGKSAIFNRLLGRRLAIVHSQSGVTRDRLMQEAEWRGERFQLVDTGGICGAADETTKTAIREAVGGQAELALSDAACIIFVVDAAAGISPLDGEAASILRKKGRFTVVAANKCDTEALDTHALEFERLGYPVFPVSALHNRGFAPMMNQILSGLPSAENTTVKDPVKVAVAGRPNVGKSSYINRLLKSERVIVSETPGTTRDSIDIPFVTGKGPQAAHYTLIDTAGIRRRAKSRTAIDGFSLMRAQKSIERSNITVLMLEAPCKPTAQDKKIASAIIEKGKGCVILVNKWDLSQSNQAEFGSAVARTLPFVNFCPVVFVSAETGYNIRRSVEAIDHVASRIRFRLPTALLNTCITDAAQRRTPPLVGGRPLKMYYATQTGIEPLSVRIFVNRSRAVPAQYRQYLIGALRRTFSLEGVPLQLQFQARKRRR